MENTNKAPEEMVEQTPKTDSCSNCQGDHKTGAPEAWVQANELTTTMLKNLQAQITDLNNKFNTGQIQEQTAYEFGRKTNADIDPATRMLKKEWGLD